MKINMVGGFLGSGKTTAISGASKLLVEQGKRVGIITNDQGKHLVDTAFFRAQDFPALEVTGGCFCCNFHDLSDQIEKIALEYDPDVIFAESVGSCADIVATVVKPLQQIRDDLGELASYSVFVDVRLLIRYLQGEELPFSEDVSYIFTKQIEEAGLIVVNKIDLVEKIDKNNLKKLISEKYSGKQMLFQNSLDQQDVADWLEQIQDRRHLQDIQSLEIDYERYARGEQQMAWVDRHYHISKKDQITSDEMSEIIFHLVSSISEKSGIAGHVKFQLQSNKYRQKLSFPTLAKIDRNKILEQLRNINEHSITNLELWINILIVGKVEQLESILDEILQDVGQDGIIKIELVQFFSRKPGYPQPNYRLN
jgi:G3E family GTPase